MADPHPGQELDPGTAAIVQLAWARSLGFDDLAFGTGSGRLERVDETSDTLSFVRLFGRTALVGPAAAVSAAAAHDDDLLADESILLDVSRRAARDHGASAGNGATGAGATGAGATGNGSRALGATVLYFGDQLIEVPDRDPGSISDEPTAAARLESRCPPDDVTEARLSTMERQFTLVDDAGEVLAAAGFDVVGGILAHLRVLVAPAVRGTGLGHYVGAVAADEAMASGLVPQWRARSGHAASQAIAARLGLVESGVQTTVLIR